MSLTLTDDAVEAVKEIVSATPEAPDTIGVRIVAEESEGANVAFQLSLAAQPADEDEVIEEQGARVFLEPRASELLSERTLDARVKGDQVAFTIAD